MYRRTVSGTAHFLAIFFFCEHKRNVVAFSSSVISQGALKYIAPKLQFIYLSLPPLLNMDYKRFL